MSELRPGWPLIWREYRKWAELKSAHGQWEPGLDSFVFGPYTITPLSSALDLVHEGWQMRHCVSAYADACRAGKYRIFSVTETSTGKRIATIGLKRRGNQWEVDQVKGKGNRDPDRRLHLVGQLIGFKVVEQEWLKKPQETGVACRARSRTRA